MADNWYEDHAAIALVTYLRYTERLPYNEIVDELKSQLGYIATGKSLREAMSNWGLVRKVKHAATYEEIVDKVRSRTGIESLKYKVPKPVKSDLILVTSDYHSPFYSPHAVNSIIRDYGIKSKNPAGLLVMSGDIWDSYSISRFQPSKDIKLIDEFNETIALIQLLAENFPKIVMLKGNHEDRVLKYFLSHGIGIDKMFLVNYDWPKHVASIFPNVSVASNKIGGHDATHYYIHGDLAVGHFEVTGGGMLGAVKKMEEWANKWRKYTDLSKCKMFLQGHVHFLGRAEIYGGDITIGETGCMCDIQEYAVKADGKYSPGVNGCWEVYQSKGITDRKKSRYITL